MHKLWLTRLIGGYANDVVIWPGHYFALTEIAGTFLQNPGIFHLMRNKTT